ncbi:NADPH-dependent FMN reductase [Streptosporangium lutulentum]
MIRFLDDLARADGIVLVTPSYHGSVSGLLKNALDYVNELAADERPFFDESGGMRRPGGRGAGAAATLATMRAIVHAMRGWPTPLGVGVTTASLQDGDAAPTDERTRRQLDLMLDQVLFLGFTMRRLWPEDAEPDAAETPDALSVLASPSLGGSEPYRHSWSQPSSRSV